MIIYCNECEGNKIFNRATQVYEYRRVYLGTIGKFGHVKFSPCPKCKVITEVIRRNTDLQDQFTSIIHTDTPNILVKRTIE